MATKEEVLTLLNQLKTQITEDAAERTALQTANGKLSADLSAANARYNNDMTAIANAIQAIVPA